MLSFSGLPLSPIHILVGSKSLGRLRVTENQLMLEAENEVMPLKMDRLYISQGLQAAARS